MLRSFVRWTLFAVFGFASVAHANEDRPALLQQLTDTSAEERVETLNAIAKSHWGDATDEAMRYARLARDAAIEIGDIEGEANAWRNVGIAHWYDANYEQALAATLEARERYEQAGNKEGMAAALSTMGTIYLNLNDMEKAQELYEEGLQIADQTDDENRIGILLSNLGTVHLGLEQPDRALVYLNRSLSIVEQRGSQLDVLTTLANIGGAHKRLENYAESLAVNQRILAVAREIDAMERQADALGDIGLSYAGLGDVAEAERYLLDAIEFAEQHELKRNVAGAMRDLADFYKAEGRMADALAMFERHMTARDEYLSEESKRAVADLEVRYETEKKEQEIAIQRLQLEKQQTRQTALIVIVGLLTLAGGVGIVLMRQKIRANRELKTLSRTDPLTRLANRRYLRHNATLQESRAKRLGEPYAIVLIDIDNFKRFNDEHGHECGDAVLTAIAASIQEAVRDVDTPSRWGGEEFLVLLPGSDCNDGRRLADRLLTAIRDTKVQYQGKAHSITATLGVTASHPGENFDATVRRADEALMRGKQSGRDQVCYAS
ncbi:MAG: virulence-mediating protein VirC [Lysobacteraceae bacterium]|nr:MAG: virulence-mediating protein VirC [Xanthomonadaceae bacterium]